MTFDWTGDLNAFYGGEIANAALKLAAAAIDVDLEETLAARGKSKAVYARQMAMYLCHVVADMSMGEVADVFSRDRTTISHACHIIEDRRDNPVFDRQVEHLERAFRFEILRIVEEAQNAELETKGFSRLCYG